MMDPMTPALPQALAQAQIAAGAPGAAELQRRYGAAIMHASASRSHNNHHLRPRHLNAA